MKCKVQVTYKSGRSATVESSDFETVVDMMEAMASTQWFLHPGGAENMLEVERIKPLSGTSAVVDYEPRRVR